MGDLDIDALVLSEHEGLRRAFADLEQSSDGDLAARWLSLAEQLEVHAAGEEAVFYPALLRDVAGSADETEHAVHDHDEIRQAVRAVEGHDAGSDGWWAAVRRAQEVTAEHLDEEEREVLPPFREGVSAEQRAELGERWLAFHDEHERARGLSGEDVDPGAYVGERT